MADILLQQIDATLLARLQMVARAQQCTPEALILRVLRAALQVDESANAASQAPDAIGVVATHWNQEETAFLRDAADAFKDLPDNDGPPLNPDVP